MKILYLSTPSFADCDIPLIHALQKKGHDVTYLLLLAPHNLQYTIIDIKKIYPKTGVFSSCVYPELNIFKDYLDIEKFYVANRISNKSYSLSYLIKTFAIWSFIRRNKFDIIHTPCFFGLKRLLLYLANKRIITTIHDPFPHTGENGLMSNLDRKLAITFSRGIVLLNEKQKDEFCELYRVKSDKICINRLGIYENIGHMASDIEEIPNCNVLFFGRISQYKGIEYLCEAMELVHKEIPDARLTIAGSGKIYFDIEKYLRQGYIHLINRFINIEEIAKLLKQSCVSVCPYVDATQSGVIMTSFALETPVIASNVGGLGEMIEDGKSGFLVEPRDHKALAAVIIKVLKNQDILNNMKEYIKSTYFVGKKSWSHIADVYLTFYKKLL